MLYIFQGSEKNNNLRVYRGEMKTYFSMILFLICHISYS